MAMARAISPSMTPMVPMMFCFMGLL
jgi:hypothetical protein